MLRDSLIGTLGGPLFRLDDADAVSECRIFLVNSVLTGPGPIFEITGAAAGGATKPPVIRSYGTVFGRLYASGIASVVCSRDSISQPEKLFDWQGDGNLFAGWKGFFASGSEQTVTVTDLAAARSTWNGTDLSSREILAPWALPGQLSGAVATDFSSFVPSHQAILARVARPRGGIYQRAVAAYSDPAVPQPAAWTFGLSDLSPNPQSTHSALLPHELTHIKRMGIGVATARPGSPGALELTFSTEAAPWRGDSGRVPARSAAAGVCTRPGAGPGIRGSSLHSGETAARRSPGDRGRGDVFRGAAAMVQRHWCQWPGADRFGGGCTRALELRPESRAPAQLEHLIRVEDGHLVLSNCQLSAGAATEGGFAGDLIAFRSASTQPQPLYRDQPLFSFPTDRPVCRLDHCILITSGRAIQAELGRGLVALSHCAVAAGGLAIELRPANVARRRFDADLVLDHCTLTSERTIVHVAAWPGQAPGPDRPWLVTSRHCAFLSPPARVARETLLLRATRPRWKTGRCSGRPTTTPPKWTGSSRPQTDHHRPVAARRATAVGELLGSQSHRPGDRSPLGLKRPSVRFRDRARSAARSSRPT